MNFRFGKAWVFAGVVAMVVLVAMIVGVFALRMYPLLAGDAAADDPIVFLWSPVPDSENDFDWNDFDWEIYVMNADGSGAVQLTDNDSLDLFPAWSPDRKRILFSSDRDNDVESYDIYVMNADGSEVEQLTNGCSNYRPAWSPDGDRIAYVSRADIYVMDADGSDVVQLTGTPRESCAHVFISYRDHAHYYRNEDGSVEPFTDWESLNPYGTDADPAWSPDGDRIAFVSGRDGHMDIYVMNVDGSGVERLTEGHWAENLSWSPNGGRIAFESWPNNDDYTELYVMNVDGSGLVQLTDNGYGDDRAPVWSPDGERIVFNSDRDGDYGIYVMNPDGSGVERLGVVEGYMPAW